MADFSKKKLSENMMEIMHLKHWSVTDLANICGVTRQTIYNWLNCKTVISFKALNRLSIKSGIPIDAILGLDKNQ